jgi:transcriptional regulator with XRE-family HTH domain
VFFLKNSGTILLKGSVGMDFYDRVNLKLKEHGMSRKELADKIGISYNTINGLYKRRSTRVRLSVVKKIADALNTSADYLATGNEVTDVEDTIIMDLYNSLDLQEKNELINYANYLINKKNREK